MNVIGLDACKMGWCGIGVIDNKLISDCFEDLHDVITKHPNLERILIDIPIGLSSKNFERTIDSQARQLLNKRKSSIFSPSCREALYANNYKEALAINKEICGKGISIQAYNIGPKIKEVDEWLNNKQIPIEVFEAHPELCLKTLNLNTDLESSKHDKAGIEERKNILFKHENRLNEHFERLMKNFKRKEVKPDDILDAMSLFLVNSKSKTLKYVQDENSVDETGKNVRIVYG
jgi:predicted RNase H-like nuclease